MKNLIIESDDEQLILKINKNSFDEDFLVSFLKRLQIEELAQKSKIDYSIIDIAEEINQEWWENNNEEFLKGVKR